MAFKRVGGTRKYYKYKECSEGQVLVEAGKYMGPEEGRYGIQHVFREPDGSQVVLNSAGHLNYWLGKEVSLGQVCRISYDGSKTLTKGTFAGKDAHSFIIELDDMPVIKTVDNPPPEVFKAESDISL